MKRASMFSAVVVAAMAIGTAGPAMAQSGAGAGAGQSGSSGAGSGQSNPAGGQAGTSGAGGTSSIAGGGQSGSDTSTGPQAASQPKTDDRQQFIEKAAIANMAEIQLGQLATSNAQDPQVKQFAQMMVDEHTKALDELRTAAGSTALPSSLDKKHQKLQDKLSKLQGAAFDRAYMDAMVDAHKDTEKLLSKRVGHNGSAQSGSTHGTTAMAGTAGNSGSGNTAGATGTSGSGTPSQSGDASGTSSGATTTAGAASEGTSASSATTGTSGSGSGSVDEWAASTLPKVQSHLAQARTINDQVKQQRDGSAGAAGGNAGPQQTPGGGTTTPPQR